MKIIRDNIWGDIPVSDTALRWIDTVEFQRLHSIRQTGLAYKVFPTATTTRFVHSLGVYHILKILLGSIQHHQPLVMEDLSPEKMEWICLAGLLHDIGHGPFSHLFDDYLRMNGVVGRWSTHEKRAIDMIALMNRKYAIMTEEAVQFIQAMIDPSASSLETKWYSHLIHNPISAVDADKMDYLVRDNQQFGLCMSVDVMRILQNCRVVGDTLCFRDKVQDELWNLFLIRHRLHSTIYRHPRISKFEKELQCVLIMMEDDEHFKKAIHQHDLDAFLRWTDAYILFHADPVKLLEFHTRTSRLMNTKERTMYCDDQFTKLNNLWFYHRDDVSQKFQLQFPSIYCPFSIPI
jgi:HD superfamily phosphohydrolase